MKGNKSIKNFSSPLWVISLFITFTEVVTGITITQATGGIQIALTVFVISFPTIIASIFFIILWKKPYVFYPPTEFESITDVQKYVSAMQNSDNGVKADLEAEVENIRSEINIYTSANSKRFAQIEKFMGEFSNSTDSVKKYYARFKDTTKRLSVNEIASRKNFNLNSQVRIHVNTVTYKFDNQEAYSKAILISNKLKELGYKTSTGGLGSSSYFNYIRNHKDYKKIRILYTDGFSDVASDLMKVIRQITIDEIEILMVSEGLEMGSDDFTRVISLDTIRKYGEVDVFIALCVD